MDYLHPDITAVYAGLSNNDVGNILRYLRRNNFEMPEAAILEAMIPGAIILRQEEATQIDTCLQRIKKFLDETMPASKYSKPNSSAGEDAAKQSCPICIEDFCVDDDVRTLTCKHLFHKDCIDKWFRQKIDCPLCRQNFLVNEYELIH